MTTPDWLKERGGELRLGSDQKTWYAIFSHQPQYALVVVPANGKYICGIRHTNSGRHIECATVYPNSEEALRGGLEQLRANLGWAT